MQVRAVVQAALLSATLVTVLACASSRQPAATVPPGSETCEGTWILTVNNPGDQEYQVTAGDDVVAIVGRGMHSFAVSASRRNGQAIRRPPYRIQRVSSPLDPDSRSDRNVQIQSSPSARMHCAK